MPPHCQQPLEMDAESLFVVMPRNIRPFVRMINTGHQARRKKMTFANFPLLDCRLKVDKKAVHEMRIDKLVRGLAFPPYATILATGSAKRSIGERRVGGNPENPPDMLQRDFIQVIHPPVLILMTFLIIPAEVEIFGIGEIDVSNERHVTGRTRHRSQRRRNRFISHRRLRSGDLVAFPPSLFAKLTAQFRVIVGTLDPIRLGDREAGIPENVFSDNEYISISRFSRSCCYLGLVL